MSTTTYERVKITITMKTQYHIGSGFGLGRLIDSLLRVDEDGVPVIPGTTVSGVTAQAMFDLLAFDYFENEKQKFCSFQAKQKNKPKPWLPCGLFSNSEPCLMCYFFGSPAEEGVIEWRDFPCITDPELLRPMMQKVQYYNNDERNQYIKPYFSHKQNMRTGTVKKKHFFSMEEGAGDLTFETVVYFRRQIPEKKILFLAAALKNVRAIGRRKSRGKGACRVDGFFYWTNSTKPKGKEAATARTDSQGKETKSSKPVGKDLNTLIELLLK